MRAGLRTSLSLWSLYVISVSLSSNFPGDCWTLGPRKEAMCLVFHGVALGLMLLIVLLETLSKPGAPERVTAVALLPQAGSVRLPLLYPIALSSGITKPWPADKRASCSHSLGRTRNSHSRSLSSLVYRKAVYTVGRRLDLLTTTQPSRLKSPLGFGVRNSDGLEHPHLAIEVTAAAPLCPHSYPLQLLVPVTFFPPGGTAFLHGPECCGRTEAGALGFPALAA